MLENYLIQISSNKKAARTVRNQTEPLIEEHDFELRLLKEFNKKLDTLIDQTVSIDPDAKHCYNMLKEQVKISPPKKQKEDKSLTKFFITVTFG